MGLLAYLIGQEFQQVGENIFGGAQSIWCFVPKRNWKVKISARLTWFSCPQWASERDPRKTKTGTTASNLVLRHGTFCKTLFCSQYNQRHNQNGRIEQKHAFMCGPSFSLWRHTNTGVKLDKDESTTCQTSKNSGRKLWSQLSNVVKFSNASFLEPPPWAPDFKQFDWQLRLEIYWPQRTLKANLVQRNWRLKYLIHQSGNLELIYFLIVCSYSSRESTDWENVREGIFPSLTSCVHCATISRSCFVIKWTFCPFLPCAWSTHTHTHTHTQTH